MDYFRTLGAALDAGWTDADRDEERFPDVAAQVLEEHPPATGFDRTVLLETSLDPTQGAGQQLAPALAFGQPGITMFHGEGFVVEVYYWLDSRTAIHNHPFCGVFTILEGWSVHARYKTSVASRAGSRGQLLDIYLSDLEVLETGAIRRFSLKRHPLIHALVHVPVPSMSMVLRTTRTEGYLRYLPPSLAIAMDRRSDPAARRIALIESMVAARDPLADEALARFLGRADFETAVQMLCGLWAGAGPQERRRLLDAIAPLHGDRLDAIAAALDRAERLLDATAVASAHRDADIRLCALALGYAQCRDQVTGLLAAREGDPTTRLHAFVDASLGGEEHEPSRIAAHALVDGGGVAQALAALDAAYGETAVAEQRAAIERFCEASMFAVLAR